MSAENLLTAVMIDHEGPRNFFLRRLTVAGFKNRFNRAIFGALQHLDGEVNISTIYRALSNSGWAAEGIATHLAELSSLEWKMGEAP